MQFGTDAFDRQLFQSSLRLIHNSGQLLIFPLFSFLERGNLKLVRAMNMAAR